MSPLGPVKPKKKPKPKKVSFVNNEFGWLDAENELEVGVEIFVCIEEETPVFDLLESGTYTLDTGIEITVIDGIIDEVVG